MSIGFYDFQSLHNEEFKAEVKRRLNKIVDENSFIEGEYNLKFEEEFAKMQGAKHCLLVANGTDALEIALQAYDIGEGDLVGVPGISFYASAEAIINRGAEPVFIDVDPETGLMDPKSLEKTNELNELSAIIPVHIYGLNAPIDELEKICDPKGIKIIEDGAQAQGTFVKTGPAGSSKGLTTFSFYPTKNLGGMGDGGAIMTQDDDLAEKIKSIRNHGRSPNGHALIGRNSRCDHFQAAALHLKLEKIEEYNKQRKEIAKKYHEALRGLNIGLVPDRYLETSSWHLYPIRLKDRDQKYALREFLNQRKIGNALFYEKSMPEETPLKDLRGQTKNAIEFAAKTLCLPMNPFLSDNDIKEVAAAIGEFLG